MIEEIFSCTRCGYCCHGKTTVSLDSEDQERMLTVLGITREEALKKYWRKNSSQIQMKIVENHCVFYKDGCTIHAGRPWRCRQWPLVDAILVDRNNLDSIRHSCPGLKKSAKYLTVCEIIREGKFLSERIRKNLGKGK